MNGLRVDVLALGGLALLTFFYAAAHIDGSAPPFEDAAMLMRYATHLAGGHGMVWNIGDPPVDGATDFLFLVVLAALVRCGIPVETATQGLGFLSHLATVLLVYVAARRLYGARPWMAALSGAYLAVGPAVDYIAAHFGTTFFTLSVGLTWILAKVAYRAARDPARPASFGPAAAFSVSALIMGLIRPEGVLLACFMLIAILAVGDDRRSRRLAAAWFVAVFGILGGAFFLWRWSYFGDPLPNPFYIKGGGALHVHSLKQSVKNLFVLSTPFWMLFVLAGRSRASLRRAAFALIPVIGFASIWILMSNDLNYRGRYQYPVLPILLVSWPAAIAGIRRDLALPRWNALPAPGRRALVALAAVLALLSLGKQHLLNLGKESPADGRYDVALLLEPHRRQLYTIATTEAGLLPLYSRWRAIDVWGLNDPWIAHHGVVTESYLERQRPEIIMFRGFFSPVSPLPPGGTRGDRMSATVVTLQHYAETHGYRLAAAFGLSARDTHHYYLRDDFPKSAELTESIRALDYRWFENGAACTNYALLQPDPGADRPRSIE